MRSVVKANPGKLDKIKVALAQAVQADDPILLQEALNISVKTRDNSYSVANQLHEAHNDPSLLAREALLLSAEGFIHSANIGATRCLQYFLTVMPHDFKTVQRALRQAITHERVHAMKVLLDFVAKQGDNTYIKHMTTFFMDRGAPDPLPILAEKQVSGWE